MVCKFCEKYLLLSFIPGNNEFLLHFSNSFANECERKCRGSGGWGMKKKLYHLISWVKCTLSSIEKIITFVYIVVVIQRSELLLLYVQYYYYEYFLMKSTYENVAYAWAIKINSHHNKKNRITHTHIRRYIYSHSHCLLSRAFTLYLSHTRLFIRNFHIFSHIAYRIWTYS